MSLISSSLLSVAGPREAMAPKAKKARVQAPEPEEPGSEAAKPNKKGKPMDRLLLAGMLTSLKYQSTKSQDDDKREDACRALQVTGDDESL